MYRQRTSTGDNRAISEHGQMPKVSVAGADLCYPVGSTRCFIVIGLDLATYDYSNLSRYAFSDRVLGQNKHLICQLGVHSREISSIVSRFIASSTVSPSLTKPPGNAR